MKLFWKDLFRTIRHSIGRFLAIAGICALGVGFFGGLQMTCGSMKQEATNFYNDTNMMDIRVVSNLGISQENVDAFKNIEGVEGAMPSRETDILTNFGSDQTAVRIHSLPNSLDNDDVDYINRPILESGDWPVNSDECVLSADAVVSNPPKIGDYIDILECSTGLDSTVSVQRLKVVGFVHSSFYMGSLQMGTSTLGKGSVGQFAYVPESFFKESFPYSEVFITVKGAKNFVSGTTEYQNYIDIVMNRLLDEAPGAAEIRSAAIRDEAQIELENAKSELLKNEAQLKLKYDEFNLAKQLVLNPINRGITTAEGTKSQAVSIETRSVNNIGSISNDNVQVNDQTQARFGLAYIIRDLNKQIVINNSLSNLVEDESTRTTINQLNSSLNLFRSWCAQFLEELSADPGCYSDYIGDYNDGYTRMQPVLSGTNQICDGVISKCNETLNNQLYPARETALAEFAEQEKPLKEAQAKINEAKAQLGISQDQILDIEAKFYIMDRTKNFGAINFSNDAERIASIANVFPLMFFFVALLVVLTSMTRMIEEERITIGSYKALGYSKNWITNKYILYGLISSLIGCVVGLAVLCQFLPYVIMFAYSIIYICPILLPMPFDFGIGALSTLVGIGLTIIATLMAAAKSLRLVPAQLMVPAAPKVGKRILLEYIKPLWKVLTFNWKITLRNMFLYKKRLFMTLIGIAGCTALLLTGFGLNDSISDIMNKQFDELFKDNFRVVFNQQVTENEDAIMKSCLAESDPDYKSTLVHEETFVAMPEGCSNASVTVVVPKNVDELLDMRVLRNRLSEQYFNLDYEGVYVTEKLASLMKVNVGDYITIYEQDMIGNAGGKEYNLLVAGIVENYITHYIYMHPDVYEFYFGNKASFDSLIAKSSAHGDAQQKLISNVDSNSFVKTSYFTTASRDTFDKMLQSVNLVVLVLIISAGLLAFVVLYNLININICERAREIATIKVLGSNKHEINMYINRETFVLSLLGSIIGILLGILLEQFVIQSAEVDYVMFGRNIYLFSYLISVGITLAFTLLVSLFMRKKIFSISMVESLKSVE